MEQLETMTDIELVEEIKRRNIKIEIPGNVDCGGSVTCGDIGGDVDAGGSVTCDNIRV